MAKNEPIATVDPVMQEDIAVLHKHVCILFPGVNPQHIQKKDVQKNTVCGLRNVVG